MVGPDSENTASVRRGSRLTSASANLSVPCLLLLSERLRLRCASDAGVISRFLLLLADIRNGANGIEGAVELGQ